MRPAAPADAAVRRERGWRPSAAFRSSRRSRRRKSRRRGDRPAIRSGGRLPVGACVLLKVVDDTAAGRRDGLDRVALDGRAADEPTEPAAATRTSTIRALTLRRSRRHHGRRERDGSMSRPVALGKGSVSVRLAAAAGIQAAHRITKLRRPGSGAIESGHASREGGRRAVAPRGTGFPNDRRNSPAQLK